MGRDQQVQLADGRTIGYAEYGKAGGRALFVLHGMPGSRRLAGAFEGAALAHGSRLIAPDRPGYGLSGRVSRPSLLGCAQDVQALADGLGVDRFGVMGVSGGGPFGLACACRLEDRMSLAAVVSGIGPLRAPGALRGMVGNNRLVFQLGRLSPAFAGWLLNRLLRMNLPAMDRYVREGASPTADISPEMFALVAADQREAIRQGGGGVAGDLRALWQPWGFDLASIRLPVFLWHGEADDLAPARLARLVADGLPRCTAVYYPGEGHVGPLTKHAGEILETLARASDPPQ